MSAPKHPSELPASRAPEKASPKGTFEVQPRRALEGRSRVRPEEVSRLFAQRPGRSPRVT